MAASTERFDSLVDHWVGEGLITAAQADRMHAEVATLEPTGGAERMFGPARGASLLGEALGYLGGSIVLVGSVLIGSWYWDDLATASRLGVLVGAALLLLSSGAVVPASMGAAGTRLRSVLWLISTGAGAGALGVLAADVLKTSDANSFLFVAGGTAAYTTALWVIGRSFLQQVAMVLAVALTTVAAINRADLSENLPGVGAWAVGVAWAVLGWLEFARPGRAALALGSVLALIGAMTTAGTDAGMTLTLVTVVLIVVAAVLLRDLLLLAVGTVGALVNTPAGMTHWFPDSIAAAFGLVAVGVTLLGTAVWITRSGYTLRQPSRPPGNPCAQRVTFTRRSARRR
jgi:hypothetical protein